MPTIEDVIREDDEAFDKAVRDGQISLDLRMPINLEEELNLAIEKFRHRLTLEDIKIYFRIAFKNFLVKVTVVETIISLFVLLLYNFIVPYLSPHLRISLNYIAIILLPTLIIVVIVRANSGLLSLVKNLNRINALYKFKQKRRDAQLLALSADRKNLRDIFESNAYYYGLALNTAKALATINSNGSARFDHEIHINATRHGVQSIERFTNVFYDSYNETPKVHLPDLKFSHSNDQVVFVSADIIQSQSKRIEWLLTANPEFPIDMPVPYKYFSEMTKPAFSMTMDELEKSGNNLEWFSQHISYPTKTISMEVVFPKEYVPENIGMSVWNTPNVKHLNKVEYERLLGNNCLKLTEKDGVVKVKLNVEYPITGVHYVITWLPMFEWVPPTPPI